MEQLQGMDASFIALERPHAPLHIGSVIIYNPETAPNGFVRFKDILSFIESRMGLSRTMRQRLVTVPFGIDYPYWIEDPNFDLEYHVRHVALPKPGDWRQLCIQAARTFSRPLDLTRPPWEILVVEGLDEVEGVPAGSYAMISKVHHAAIDGMSGIDLMHALHALTASTAPPNTPDNWKPERMPSQAGLFARGYVRGWTLPLRQTAAVAKALPGAARVAKGLVTGDFDLESLLATPKTRFNKSISAARVVEGRTFPLKGIKAIRSLSEGCKVNDVMLALVGGALNKYLAHYNELPDKTLTAMAPISVRSEGEKNTMGNQVSAMLVPLGSHIDDPAQRLSFVHEQTLKSKAMTNAMGARQMTEISKHSPNLFMGLGARLYSQLGIANRIKPIFNTIVTNVPGPPIPIYSTGARVENLFGMLCLLDGLGLGHVVQSYVDKLTVMFTACREMMPDPEFYAACLQASYDDLIAAAGYIEAAPVSETPAAKPKAKTKPKAKRKTASKKTAVASANRKKTTRRKTTAKTKT
ncbi:MAG: wax ester/triacylglycerol synthase family O-acyltransferase [Hyphomonadaceae bacterium]